jgi:hypothetical protein
MLSAVKDADRVYNPIIRNLSMTAVESGIARTKKKGEGRDLRTLIRDLMTDPIIREIPSNLRHLIPYHPECWINIFYLISDKRDKKFFCADVIRVLLESDFLFNPEMMSLKEWKEEDYLASFVVGTLYILSLLDIIVDNYEKDDDHLLITMFTHIIITYYYTKIKGNSLSQKKKEIIRLANMFDVIPLTTGIRNTLILLLVGNVLEETATKKDIEIARIIADKLKKGHPLDFVGKADRLINEVAKKLSKDERKNPRTKS